jgi:hypothetical protein
MQEYGMKEGIVEVVCNPRLKSKIPGAILEKAEEAVQQIIAGKSFLSGGASERPEGPRSVKRGLRAIQ